MANLQQQALNDLDALAQHHLDQRDYQQAQQYAWQQLDIDNLRESAVHQLMTALARSGQRSAAMAQYEIYVKRLEQTSGEEPSAELTELYQRIQNDELQQTMLRHPAMHTPEGENNPIFCYTDIESSTRLWDEHREAMLGALRQHNDLCETEIEQFDGRILHPTGDGFLIVFEQNDPLAFAISLQQQFNQADWGEIGELRIRIGFHGATADQEGHEYFHDDGGWYRGPVLNHAARIADTGHGGQIVASDMVKEYCPLPPGASWEDLGSHNLKSLDEAYHIYGLHHPDLTMQKFPALRTPANKKKAQVGSHIRGYDLGSMIGQGAFGEVYQAEQPGVGRPVAVKIIRPRFANQPEFIRRFEAEAQVIARLEHPHIVPLYDYWREADGAFLVMRFMRGGSLKALLEAGALDLEITLALIDQVGSALAFAHQQGFVHRDIKPANILLDETGNGYLSDFGIVKDLEKESEEPPSDSITGTPAYLSPEQALSQPVSPLSDQYSLGVMLFEMVTGLKPFDDTSASNLLDKQVEEPLPLVSTAHPGIPPAVDEIIQRATAKDSGARFDDIPDMIRALHSAAQKDGTGFALPADFVQLEEELVNPYKGLRSFQEADAVNFFGRRALIEQLITRFSSEPASGDSPTDRFLAVIGPSGSGKSSVVKAGLLPALRRGTVPGSEKWFMVEMIPGTHPLEELEAALLRIAVDPPESLLDLLQGDEQGLSRALQQILPDDGSELFLMVDQFEELFTLVEDEALRRHFINILLAALDSSDSQLRVVITVRADFYDRPLMIPGLAELMRQCTEIVPPLNKTELEEVILQPALQVGAMFEMGLVPSIIDDVSEQPGALPLLQYALTELFERRQERLLTKAAYEDIGGVLGALGRRAEELYTDLDEDGEEGARQMFMRLVTLGEGTEDTRRRVLRSELTALGVGAVRELPSVDRALREAPLQEVSVMETVIDAYGRYRLLTFDRDPLTREPTVEVAHEALLRDWPRLRQWLDDSRDDVRLQRRLSLAVAEWVQADRGADYLVRGSRLDLFISWFATTQLALTQEEQLFLDTSEAARQQRQAEEDARVQRELETAQQLVREQTQRAEEQEAAAQGLRKRALFLGAALVIAAVLAIAAVMAGRQSSLNAAEAAENANLAATRAAEASTNAELAAAREAEAQTNADLAAANEVKALANANLALTREAEAETQRALAEEEAKQRAIAQAEAEREAQIAFSRELAAGTLNSLDTDPELGILLALQALSTTHTLEAENALHQAVQSSPLRQAYYHEPGTGYFAVQFHPYKPQYFVSGRGGGTLWDIDKKEAVFTTTAPDDDWINEAGFTPDGKHLIMPGETYEGDAPGHPVTIVNAETGEKLVEFIPDEEYTQAVVVSPDGKLFATIGPKETVKIWDLQATLAEGDGQLVATLCCLEGAGTRGDFSSDGTRLVIKESGDNHFASVWDVSSGEKLFVLDSSNLRDARFSPNGNYLITGKTTGQVEIWEAATGERLSTTLAHPGNQIRYVGFSPDGSLVATASSVGEVGLWHFLPEGLQKIQDIPGHKGRIIDADFCPDGQCLITTGTDDETSRLWDISPSGRAELNAIAAHETAIYDLGFIAEHDQLVTADFAGTIKLWDVYSGNELFAIGAHEDRINRLAASPDGKIIATAGNEGTAKLWDRTSGELINILEDPAAETDDFGFIDVAFSPNGDYLATGGWAGALSIWDVATGEHIYSVSDGGLDVLWGAGPGAIWDITFSRSGELLVTASGDSSASVRDAATGETVLKLSNQPPSQYTSLDITPDESLVLTGRRDGEVEMWRLPDDPRQAEEDDAELLYGLESGVDYVWSARFSPDGSQFALSGLSGIIEIRNTSDGELKLALQLPTPSSCAYFTPDGDRLITCGDDGIVRMFTTNLNDLIELAQSRTTRPLTQEECRQYLHTEACP